jgi:diacylglycerol kinase
MLNFLKGFLYAFNGLVVFFRHERNGRIQLLVAVVVVLLGWGCRISTAEWIVLLGSIATVLSFEMINSSIEKLCNLVHPKYHPAVKTIKDISAGAVLWVSVFCAIIGAIIFLPKINILL